MCRQICRKLDGNLGRAHHFTVLLSQVAAEGHDIVLKAFIGENLMHQSHDPRFVCVYGHVGRNQQPRPMRADKADKTADTIRGG